jgi:hypothetical protein
MNKRLGIPLAILLLALLGGVIWQTPRQREPVYQGKPLSFWLKDFELDAQLGKPSSDQAVEAVRQAGTNAFPILLRLFRARDSDLKHRVTSLARKQHFITIHYVTADSQRWVARQGFMALGRVAKYAVPRLVEINQEDIARSEKGSPIR